MYKGNGFCASNIYLLQVAVTVRFSCPVRCQIFTCIGLRIGACVAVLVHPYLIAIDDAVNEDIGDNSCVGAVILLDVAWVVGVVAVIQVQAVHMQAARQHGPGVLFAGDVIVTQFIVRKAQAYIHAARDFHLFPICLVDNTVYARETVWRHRHLIACHHAGFIIGSAELQVRYSGIGGSIILAVIVG